MSARAPSGWQGPLRAAAAVFAIGFLVVWLVKPIGNPCPDLQSLPQGSTASSSPTFSPPGARTCTYTVAGGTEAKVKHVPWLDWIVLALLAAAAAGAVRFASPAGRLAREERAGRPAPRAQPPRQASSRERPGATERDAADRERARQERAARDRARRER